MRVIVTGGAGFIGSHIVDALVDSGHEVAVIDNLTTGREANVNKKAIFHEVDLRDDNKLDRVFNHFQPDIVSHQAAQAHVPKSVEHPSDDADVNIVGGLRLLTFCRKYNVRKLIFASTGGAIYGNPDTQLCRESEPPKPLSPYGVSKYSFEQYLAMYARSFGFTSTVLRYANVYGPRQDGSADEGRVVPIFIQRMLSGQYVVVDGDGTQTRDLIHVDDIVRANLAAMTRGDGVTFNIGTGKGTSVNELFKQLCKLIPYSLPPRFGPGRQGDVHTIVLDTTAARVGLKWTPAIDLGAGLADTIEYFMGRLSEIGAPRP